MITLILFGSLIYHLCYVKRISASILLILFTIQIAWSGFVAVWYYANQHYIATVLCVNKEKKDMGCNGKCALNKKLAEAENSPDKEAPLSLKKPVEASPFLLVQSKEIIFESSLSTVYFQIPDQQYHYDLNEDIFHPPTFPIS